ncbi:MAG: hypothetical protein AAGK47_04025 [Bacteroidota bacterium]
MNSTQLQLAGRFIGLLILQVLVFQQVPLGSGWFAYTQIILYPVFILLLPLKTPPSLVILLAFLLGLGVDMFYDSPGIHASASVFMGWMRPTILRGISPMGGYDIDANPTKRKYGWFWFMQYAGILLALHLFWYFCIEVFTPVYYDRILWRWVTSWSVSMILVTLYQFIFDPK